MQKEMHNFITSPIENFVPRDYLLNQIRLGKGRCPQRRTDCCWLWWLGQISDLRAQEQEQVTVCEERWVLVRSPCIQLSRQPRSVESGGRQPHCCPTSWAASLVVIPQCRVRRAAQLLSPAWLVSITGLPRQQVITVLRSLSLNLQSLFYFFLR